MRRTRARAGAGTPKVFNAFDQPVDEEVPAALQRARSGMRRSPPLGNSSRSRSRFDDDDMAAATHDETTANFSNWIKGALMDAESAPSDAPAKPAKPCTSALEAALKDTRSSTSARWSGLSMDKKLSALRSAPEASKQANGGEKQSLAPLELPSALLAESTTKASCGGKLSMADVVMRRHGIQLPVLRVVR